MAHAGWQVAENRLNAGGNRLCNDEVFDIYLDEIWRGKYNSCFMIDKRFTYNVMLLHKSDEKN